MSESDIRVILVAIGRLEEKVDGIGKDNIRGETVHQDFEKRIRSLEKVRWLIAGACLAVGGTGGALAYKVLGV